MIMASSPLSEIHPRNGLGGGYLPPRPNSVLEDPSYFPPLSPPPDFHSGYMSDVPTSSLHRRGCQGGGPHYRPRRQSNPQVLRPDPGLTPETGTLSGGGALAFTSFKPIPSISQPTPEEIQRDVDIVFHNLGLDDQSPILGVPPPPSSGSLCKTLTPHILDEST